MAPRTHLVLLVLLLGCSRKDLFMVDLADRTETIAFIAVLDETDRTVRLTKTFGIDDGRISFGERPQIELSGHEATAVLIELTRMDLSRAHPDFAVARATETTVRLSPPPVDPMLRIDPDPENPLKETAIPATAKLTELSQEGGALDRESDRARAITSQVTLVLPSDPEHCRPVASFEPFGREATVVVGSLEQVISLGDRALLRTSGALHLLERGGAIDPAKSFDVSMFEEEEISPYFTDVAVDPIPNADGSLRAMATVMLDEETKEIDPSVIVELSIADRITYVRTATRAELELERVAISDDGRTAALAEQAIILLENLDGSFTRVSLGDLGPDPKARTLIWSGDPTRPLIATSRNRVHFAEPSLDRFRTELVTLPSEQSVHIFALAKEGDEIWAGGSGGWLARLNGRMVERIPVRLPPRYLECSTAQGDLSLFEDEIAEMALDGGYAFLVLESCSALMAIRASDACVSLVSFDGTKPHFVDHHFEGPKSVHAANGEILIGDAFGRAWRARF